MSTRKINGQLINANNMFVPQTNHGVAVSAYVAHAIAPDATASSQRELMKADKTMLISPETLAGDVESRDVLANAWTGARQRAKYRPSLGLGL